MLGDVLSGNRKESPRFTPGLSLGFHPSVPCTCSVSHPAPSWAANNVELSAPLAATLRMRLCKGNRQCMSLCRRKAVEELY